MPQDRGGQVKRQVPHQDVRAIRQHKIKGVLLVQVNLRTQPLLQPPDGGRVDLDGGQRSTGSQDTVLEGKGQRPVSRADLYDRDGRTDRDKVNDLLNH